MAQNLKYAGTKSLLHTRRSKRASRASFAYSVTHFSTVKSRFALKEEMLEDARLNAIADERAEGPFVKVSLDDL